METLGVRRLRISMTGAGNRWNQDETYRDNLDVTALNMALRIRKSPGPVSRFKRKMSLQRPKLRLSVWVSMIGRSV